MNLSVKEHYTIIKIVKKQEVKPCNIFHDKTNSLEQNPSWETNTQLTKISMPFLELEGSLYNSMLLDPKLNQMYPGDTAIPFLYNQF
jgi:hypothetical protein